MFARQAGSHQRRTHRRERGMMLLEALIAVLIFSIGILGIVGLQATAVKQSTDARYRAEAAQLAERLIGQMWAGDRSTAALQASFDSDCVGHCNGYNDWYDDVEKLLPGVDAAGRTRPMVDVDPAGKVTINVFWLSPIDDQPESLHHYDVQAQIRQ